MNEEELKKKIVDILIKADEDIISEIIKVAKEHRAFLTEENQYYYIVADALIDTIVGDISEVEKKLKITERALLNRAKMYVEMQGYPSWDVPVLASEFVVPEDLKNAEIELFGGKSNE